MKQVPEHQRLAQIALFDGLLAVCRARERGEPWWALDIRRAQSRLDALRAAARARRAQPGSQPGEP